MLTHFTRIVATGNPVLAGSGAANGQAKLGRPLHRRHHAAQRRLAKCRGIKVIERAVWPEELEAFEQGFLTDGVAEVTPISAPTKQLQKDYSDLVWVRLSDR